MISAITALRAERAAMVDGYHALQHCDEPMDDIDRTVLMAQVTQQIREIDAALDLITAHGAVIVPAELDMRDLFETEAALSGGVWA